MVIMIKKQSIDLSQFQVTGDITIEKVEGGYLATFPEEGGRLLLAGSPMHLGGVDWTDASHLVFDMTCLEDFELAMVCHFASGKDPQDPCAIFNTGTLPGLRVMSPIPLAALDSAKMFIPRTPGRVKQIVLGRGVGMEQVVALTVATKKCFKQQRVLIHDIYLTWGKPEYVIEDKIIVDTLGQFKLKEWKGKTKSEPEMVARLRNELEGCDEKKEFAGWSRFGGDLSTSWEGTGYFRTHFDGERWYLADPEGYRFVSLGLDCCAPGDEENYAGIEKLHEEMPDLELFADAYDVKRENDYFKGKYLKFPIVNLIRAFGKDWKKAWIKLTKSRMVDWYMNTIGNWSDAELIQQAKLPYVWPLQGFPTTKTCIFRDFPDVYSDEYAINSTEFGKQMEAFKGDPYMIGYFLRNEPEWAFVQNLLIAEKVLENPTTTCCKKVFIEELKEKYQDIQALNDAWNKDFASFEDLNIPMNNMAAFSEHAKEDAHEFSVKMIKRYVALPSQACKKVDPDHMNLGMRYAMLIDPILLEGHENFDVFSLNCYSDDPYQLVQQAGEITGKPVIVGEFHFGALDAGMLSAGIRSVLTQKDRGLAYRAYYEKAMDSPYFVGSHYFTLNDQATLGRYDGENMQIGFVDVCQRPYEAFIELARETNHSIYSIADGERIDPEAEINRIPQIMGF